ncbi:MAG: AbrB family transcriptional regulator [Gammaproteobacteria bacterium]|nr:AbrB family transcriptional regulator [Gammaproteobacteria bacterium]
MIISNHVIPVLTAFALSLLGVLLFLTYDLPLPWLLGSVFPLIIISRFKKIKLAPPAKLVKPARGLLGIAIGASFTPAIVESLGQYLISLAFMLPFLVVIIVVGKLYYQYIIKFDKDTSIFCALPGGLLEMTLICETQGANLKQVVLTHTTRVLLIIYVIPFLIQYFTSYDLSSTLSLSNNGQGFDLIEASIIVAIAFIGWMIAHRLGLGGASIVGPMIVCALLYITGWVSYKPPGELINLAQLILGIHIGLTLKGVEFKEIVTYFFYALGLFIFLIIMSLITAYCVNLITDIPLMATFLAFVPGGQAEMNVVAIMIGIHVPYIALHHVTRMFLVVALGSTIRRAFG